MYTRETKEEIIKNYDRLLRQICNKEYVDTPKYSYDDLLQEARSIALSSVHSWDEQKGANLKFITYLSSQVTYGVRRFKKENSYDISVTEYKFEKDWKREKERRENATAGKEVPMPTVEPKKTPSSSFDTLTQALALRMDWTVGHSDGEEVEMSDILPSGHPSPEDEMIKKESIEVLNNEIGKLGAREQYVLDGLFFKNKHPEQIASEMCVRAPTVLQIKKNAIQKLSDILKDKIGP